MCYIKHLSLQVTLNLLPYCWRLGLFHGYVPSLHQEAADNINLIHESLKLFLMLALNKYNNFT